MEREKYIKSILNEHLLNKDGTYQQITKEQAEDTLEDFADELCDAISFEDEKDFEDELKVYFSRGFEQMKRIPQFYGT